MPLLLDPTLQSRLDGIEREPAIEIVSSTFFGSIPFMGNSFGISGAADFKPHLIAHSSGRLAQLYIDSSNKLKWMYTDTDRNQWSTYNLGAVITGDVAYTSAVELDNGNIGLIVLWADGRLWSAEIDITGTVVSGLSLIEALSGSYDWHSPYVTQLANGDFYMVYVREDAATPAYAIYARTATSWGTWGADSDVTPAGVNTAREVANPSLFQTAEGDLFLLFDHVTAVQDAVTIKNIFSAISTDNGASFDTAEARTNYVTYGTNGLDPIMIQRSNGTTWLVFYESSQVLHMTSSATGFYSCSSCDHAMNVKDLHMDSANGKLLVTYGNTNFGGGNKCVGGVAVVDINTWTIDKIYTCTSTPAINSVFANTHVWDISCIHGDGKYIAFSTQTQGGHTAICVIDHTADAVTHYMMDDISVNDISDGLPNWYLPRNVAYNGYAPYGIFPKGLKSIRVDATRGRVYMGWDGGYIGGYYLNFSYIDLTDSPDGEGFYDMTWVTDVSSWGVLWDGTHRYNLETGWIFELDPVRHYIIVSASGFYGIPGTIAILAEDAECAAVKTFNAPGVGVDTNPSAPHESFNYMVIHNGAIYGDTIYYAPFPHTDQRGLCKIDYLTDTITYFRPSYATVDNYQFRDFAVDEDGQYMYIAGAYGIARFDIAGGTWAIYNNQTLPGFTPNLDGIGHVVYDPVTGNIMGGSYGGSYMAGINMFNEDGVFTQLKYDTADKAAAWMWAASVRDLSYYRTAAYPAAVIDPEDVLWVTWNNVDYTADQNVLHWDNDRGNIYVMDDITGPVTINWRLKRVNTLEFRLGNGHLYDPQNLLSTRNVVGQKGRKTHVRIGEKIGGYTYWVNQGTFIVDTSKMEYKRGDAPILAVNCTGKTSLWRQQQIPVTELYGGQLPDTVIAALIADHTEWVLTDYDIPTFNNEHTLYYQWVDKTLWDIIEELCDHFFYAMYEDADGVFTCREVSLTQAVDHEYADDMQLINFSPDDNYSDYTNRVRVIGETNDYTEVVHNEEMITSRGGTIGWWAKKTDETIYFSDDRERQCRNPRLSISHSPKEYGLLLDQLSSGSGGITVTYVDPYEKYIIVEIEVPDLTAAFVGAVAAMVLIAAASTWCGASLFSTCGPYIWATAIAASLVFYILAAMAQYQYEVWARPLGRVKSTIQYEANDIDFQRKLNGEIVTEEITDPLCQSVTECRRVAEGNLELVKAQRRRISFTKLAHLQDELMDKIKVYHPYSNEAMELLVVGLKRTYLKGGGVTDSIDGWRYIP